MHTKKLNWPSATERVLAASDGPLTATEIVRVAEREGWVIVKTQHPSYSVKGAILNHIKAGNSRRFLVVRGAPNEQYRYWLLCKRT